MLRKFIGGLTLLMLSAAAATAAPEAKPIQPHAVKQSPAGQAQANAPAASNAERLNNYEAQRQVRDLLAQEGMNDAAQRMLGVANQQLLLGWLTLAGLAVTVALALRANGLNREALDLARRTALAELRPYLSVRRFSMFDDVNGDLFFSYEIENTGVTSAINICWDFQAMLVDGVPTSVEIEIVPDYIVTPEIAPSASKKFRGTLEVYRSEIKKAVLEKKKSIVIRVHVIYYDALDNRYDYTINQVRTGPNLNDGRVNRRHLTHSANHLPPSSEMAKPWSLFRRKRASAPGAMGTTAGR